MLLEQVHIGHRHATVHGFAHVVNREQGYLHGLQINNLAHTTLHRWA